MGDAARKVESKPEVLEKNSTGNEEQEVDQLLQEIDQLKDGAPASKVEATASDAEQPKRQKISAKELFSEEDEDPTAEANQKEETNDDAEKTDNVVELNQAEEASVEEQQSIESQLDHDDDHHEETGSIESQALDEHHGNTASQSLSLNLTGDIELQLNYQVGGTNVKIYCEETHFVIQLENGTEFRVPLTQ